MKKFVQISSTKTIRVAPDLRHIDATDPLAPLGDKLNVKTVWTKFIVLVKTGIFWYPAQMKDWGSIKGFVKAGIMTIGAESDTCPNQEEVEAIARKLELAQARYESDKERIESNLKRVSENKVGTILKNIAN